MSDSSIDKPIFAKVFGAQWSQLPPVLQKHYANRAFSSDQSVVEGHMDIQCRGPLRLLQPFYRLLGGIPAVSVSQVPTTVQFNSVPDGDGLIFERRFHFADRRPYRFSSRMQPMQGNEVIEVMRFGICWRSAFSYADNTVSLSHRGYALRCFGRYIKLPITVLMGRGDAVEIAVDDDRFDMKVQITHPWFGEIYSYAGQFKVTKQVEDS